MYIVFYFYLIFFSRRTNGRAYVTVLRLSVVCPHTLPAAQWLIYIYIYYTMYCGYTGCVLTQTSLLTAFSRPPPLQNFPDPKNSVRRPLGRLGSLSGIKILTLK